MWSAPPKPIGERIWWELEYLVDCVKTVFEKPKRLTLFQAAKMFRSSVLVSPTPKSFTPADLRSLEPISEPRYSIDPDQERTYTRLRDGFWTKEQRMAMAELEGDSEIGAGVPSKEDLELTARLNERAGGNYWVMKHGRIEAVPAKRAVPLIAEEYCVECKHHIYSHNGDVVNDEIFAWGASSNLFKESGSGRFEIRSIEDAMILTNLDEEARLIIDLDKLTAKMNDLVKRLRELRKH